MSEATGLIVVRIAPRSKVRGDVAHPCPKWGEASLAASPYRMLGRWVDDESPVMANICQHGLYTGQTQGGKSTGLQVLLRHVVPDLFGDPVGMDFATGKKLGLWEPAMAAPLARTPEQARELLEAIRRVLVYREQLLAVDGECNLPYLFVVVDELPSWMHVDRKSAPLLEYVVERSAEVRICWRFSAQNPTSSNVGTTEMRAQLRQRMAWRLDRHMSSQLWPKESGYSSTGLRQGQFVLNDDDHQVMRKAKGAITDRAEVTKLVAEAAKRDSVLDAGSLAELLGKTAPKPTAEHNSNGLSTQTRAVFNALAHWHTVKDLGENLDMTRDQVNHYLKQLDKKKLVSHPKAGVWMQKR